MTLIVTLNSAVQNQNGPPGGNTTHGPYYLGKAEMRKVDHFHSKYCTNA